MNGVYLYQANAANLVIESLNEIILAPAGTCGTFNQYCLFKLLITKLAGCIDLKSKHICLQTNKQVNKHFFADSAKVLYLL